MIESYTAYILFCSIVGKCLLFADMTGSSASVQGCRVNLDAMVKRAQSNPFPITSKIGVYKVSGLHRGFCINDGNTFEQNWEVYYDL